MAAQRPYGAPQSRTGAALSLALAGGVSLFAALLTHEVLTFGAPGHGLINADRSLCPDIACPTIGVILVAHIAKSIGAALLFALIGAVWSSGRFRYGIAALAFTLQFLVSLVGIASGYRVHFGTSWAWWEPFVELLWQPLVTLPLLVMGLALCLVLDAATTRRHV